MQFQYGPLPLALYTLRDDGYVDCEYPPLADYKAVSVWHDIPTFRHCCTYLRERSRQVVGELMLTGSPPEVIATIRVSAPSMGGEDCWRSIHFFAVNQLTEETAFGLLHLLSHLHSHVFDYVRILETVVLNPRVLDLLYAKGESPYSLRCGYLNLDTTEMALRYVEEVGSQRGWGRWMVFDYCLDYGNDELDNALQLVTTAGRVCRGIDFDTQYHIVDPTIEVGALT